MRVLVSETVKRYPDEELEMAASHGCRTRWGRGGKGSPNARMQRADAVYVSRQGSFPQMKEP